MHTAIAVTPDQLTGKVDGNNDGDNAERAKQWHQQRKGHWDRRRAVNLVSKPKRATGVEQANQDQHEEGWAGEYQVHLQSCPCNQSWPCGRRLVGHRQAIYQCGLLSCLFRLALLLFLERPGRNALFGKAVA